MKSAKSGPPSMVDFQWLIGGEAGYGIMTVGAIMGKVFTRLGLSVFDYTEYPSLIRGGHNAYYVRASDEEIFCQKQPVDILVALNRETIDRHKHELTPQALVVYDPNVTKVESTEFTTQTLILIPFLELTKQVGADRLMINTVAVGASIALLYNDFSVLEGILKDIFGRKGEKVIALNVDTSRAGFDYVVKNFAGKSQIAIQEKPQENLFIGGAESLALGAIRAGVKFAAIYPMTPINAVLTTLSAYALKYNIVVKEPEDEIAGVNMAIGASFAGVRSIAATSGGGFALMVEGLGLAAQTETPLVVIEGMRPGPATGMPTWTDQGDVRFVLHAAHGDFPRIVVAPGDCLEAFTYVMEAFNLAEKYQMLVIVLTDKYLNEGHTTLKISNLKSQISNYKIDRGKMLTDEEALKETDYKRYLFTEDGISPRSIPGQQNGIALNGSDEHDEKGLYNETSKMRTTMMDKRFKKLDAVAKILPPPVIYGDKDASLTIVGFGSTKLPVLEAIKWLKKEGISVNFLQVVYLNPFPADVVLQILTGAKKTLVIEGNKTGQFESVVREKTGFVFSNHFRKYDGRPFYPEEIVEKVRSLL